LLSAGAVFVLLGGSAAATNGPATTTAPATSDGGYGAHSLTPEVLARYAPPPLSADLSRRIQAGLDLRAPGRAFLTPDGKRLFFEWNVTGIWQVWRLDGPHSFPVQVTGGEDSTGIRGMTPDGRYLILTRDRKGENKAGLYLQPTSGGPLELVQHTPGSQTRFGFVTKDSRFLFYTANDIQPDSYAVYRFEITTRRRTVVFDQPGNWDRSDERDDGARLLLLKWTSGHSEAFEYLPDSKTLIPVIGQGEEEKHWVNYGARPGEILVVTSKLGDAMRLYSLFDRKLTPLSSPTDGEILDFSHDRAWHRVYYETRQGGLLATHVLDAHTYKPIDFPKFPGAWAITGRPVTLDGRYARINVSSSRAPDRSFIYDWNTKKLVEWVLPSTPEIDTSHFVDATLESYPARDGTAIPMWVQRPEKCAAPCPVIILFHGGPAGIALPGFDPLSQLLVQSGFILARPNVRGSGGMGKAWDEADDGAKRLQVITDIEDAARYFRSAGASAGKTPKIGVFGWSYGGYSTLMAMTRFAGAYDAGVSLYGISHLATLIDNGDPYTRSGALHELGDPVKDRQLLEELSPMHYVDRMTGPLLLIAGGNDSRVPAGESIQFHDALAARGTQVPMIIFPDEGHGAQRRDNEALEFGYVLAFFQQHLQGDGPKPTSP
jgi:dipeptidyl aminopeptidase/acylaminoacyl peptidase